MQGPSWQSGYFKLALTDGNKYASQILSNGGFHILKLDIFCYCYIPVFVFLLRLLMKSELLNSEVVNL